MKRELSTVCNGIIFDHGSVSGFSVAVQGNFWIKKGNKILTQELETVNFAHIYIAAKIDWPVIKLQTFWGWGTWY